MKYENTLQERKLNAYAIVWTLSGLCLSRKRKWEGMKVKKRQIDLELCIHLSMWWTGDVSRSYPIDHGRAVKSVNYKVSILK